MNFFQRRKILKSTNSLHLVPVRLLDSTGNESGKTDILLPRFKNTFLRNTYRNSKKGEFIRIHLDHVGSAIWSYIDGRRTMEEIATLLNDSHLENLHSTEDFEKRVIQFISLLYRERYITFKQLLDKSNPPI